MELWHTVPKQCIVFIFLWPNVDAVVLTKSHLRTENIERKRWIRLLRKHKRTNAQAKTYIHAKPSDREPWMHCDPSDSLYYHSSLHAGQICPRLSSEQIQMSGFTTKSHSVILEVKWNRSPTGMAMSTICMCAHLHKCARASNFFQPYSQRVYKELCGWMCNDEHVLMSG